MGNNNSKTADKNAYWFNRREVLTSIGASAVVSTGFVGVSAAQTCDTTVTDSDTLQTAIDNALPGDTICVEAGTYDPIEIDVTDLTLLGPNAGIPGSTDQRGSEATIDEDTPPNSGGDAVSIEASGVTFDGFEVTSDGQDGVRFPTGVSDVTIANNRIVDIAGNTFAGTLSAGNAVNIQPTNLNQTYDSIVIDQNLIQNINSPDTTGEGTVTAIQVLANASDVADLEITNNTIKDIGGDENEEEARGITLDVNIRDSTTGTITAPTINRNDIEQFEATDVAAIALFENVVNDPDTRVGPENFSILNNNITDLTTTGSDPAAALFVGGYENLGDDHTVKRNSFTVGSGTGAAVTRILYDQGGFDQAKADTLDAKCNWWDDEDGPSGDGPGDGVTVEGKVEFEPWLTEEDGPCNGKSRGRRRGR